MKGLQISLFDLDPSLEKESLLTAISKTNFPYGTMHEHAKAEWDANHDEGSLAELLKHELGIGGYSMDYNGERGFLEFNSNGATFKVSGYDSAKAERFSYKLIAREIIRLINNGQY